METSKTYFFSSSCLCVSGVSGRAVGGEENDFFLKYGRRRLRRCGVGTAVHREKESSTYRKHSIQKRRKKHLRFSDGCDAAAHQRAVHPICGRRGISRRKKRKGKRRGRGQPNVEVEEEGTERHIFSTLNCHAIRRFVLVPFAPGGSPAANASAGGVARNSEKTRKQRATCRTTECRRHVVSQLFRRIGVVIVQLSTPVLLPVARAELQIESFANMSAFSGNTAVLPIAKTAQLALVFVKEKNKGRVF